MVNFCIEKNNSDPIILVFKNTFWLAAAEAVSRLLKAVLLVYVARVLGAANYGKFTFALSFVSLFVIFSDFGLSTITTRELSREKEKEREFPAIFSLKILLSLGALVLMLSASLFITPDPLIRKVIWILAVYILVSNFSEIVYAFFRACQRMEYEAWVKILQSVAIAGAGFLIIFIFPSVENLSYCYLFASLVALISILVFFHLKIFPLKFSWQKSVWKKFLAMSWPIGLGAIFATAHRSIDSIIMGYSGFITQVGWYNAASKIINIIVIPSILISQGFYPALSKAFKESGQMLQSVWNYQIVTVISLAIPLVVGGIALASQIIAFIYNSGFTPSVFAFQILVAGAGIIFLNRVLVQALIVSNQQKKVLLASLFGAVVNIVLNLILIPKFTLFGAAFASLITLLLIFFFLSLFTAKFTPVRPLNAKVIWSFAGATFSSIPMYFVISQPVVRQLNIFLSIFMGAATYLTSLFLYKKAEKYIFRFIPVRLT